MNNLKFKILPAGYTQLEYIHTDANAWIDTGVSLASFLNKTDSRIVMKLAWTNLSDTQLYQVNGWANNPQIGIAKQGTSGSIYYWQNYNTGTQPVTENQIYTATLDFASNVGVLKVPGFTDLQAASTSSITAGFRIGGFTGGGNQPFENIYEVWMYQNGLIHHYIPCKNSSNVIGMYDVVTNTFYSSVSENSFTAGPEKSNNVGACYQRSVEVDGKYYNIPSYVIPVEYIESTGTQYIDTGLLHTDLTVEYEAKTTLSSTASQIFLAAAANVAWAGWKNGKASICGTDIDVDATEFRKYSCNYTSSMITLSDVATGLTASTYNSELTSTLHLFSWNGGLYSSQTAVKQIKFTNSSNTLLGNFIPAKVNNIVGMWDTVSETFFTNSGTGDFTAGNELTKDQIYHYTDCIKEKNGDTYRTYDMGFQRTMAGSNPYTALDARNKKTEWSIKGNTKQGVLPDGYTQLEYLENTDTCWIDAGIKATDNSKVEIGVMFNNSGTEQCAIGSRDAGGSRCQYIHIYSGRFCAAIYNTFHTSGDYVTANTKYDLTSVVNGMTMNVYNGSTLVSTATGTTGSLPNSNITLFRRSLSTSPTSLNGKIYYCRIYISDVLTRNFIPAKNSSNVLGMYDTVTNTFFTNVGTGTFTAGPALPTPTTPVDVNGCGNSGLPTGYKKLQYVNMPGGSYINTGIIYKSAPNIETTFASISGTDIAFFGNSTTGNGSISYDVASQANYIRYGTETPTHIVYEEGITYVPYVSKIITETNVFHTVKIENDNHYVDGIHIGYWKAQTTWDQNTREMLINKGHYGISNAKWKSFKMWENGVLEFNGIPAQRISDSVIGMYDTVTNTFFTNSGTGDFIAGPEDTACVVPVKVSGKNLFNPSTFDGSTPENIRYHHFAVENGTYTMSSPDFPLNGNITNIFFIAGKVSSGASSSGNGVAMNKPITISVTDGYYTIAERLSTSQNPNEPPNYSWQTEKGSTATAYEPYAGEPTTYNINLPAQLHKIGTYIDSIESDGTLTRGVGKLILTGTEGWTYTNNAIYARLAYANIPLYGLCSHFKYSTASVIAEMNDGEFIYNKSGGATNGNLSLKSSLFTDLTTATTWLATRYAAGTPVTVMYPLASATTETISVPEIKTETGTNYLQITTEVQPSEATITYLKKNK